SPPSPQHTPKYAKAPHAWGTPKARTNQKPSTKTDTKESTQSRTKKTKTRSKYEKEPMDFNIFKQGGGGIFGGKNLC
ncbi:hypothetical protein, partial [Pseudomonas syringae group genomosp. 7]|uniref:hypothetical protein n=1 Tax=Pseudomonas syringae group genomosp. 7 TaxID=251699 RepID=UPI00376F5B48